MTKLEHVSITPSLLTAVCDLAGTSYGQMLSTTLQRYGTSYQTLKKKKKNTVSVVGSEPGDWNCEWHSQRLRHGAGLELVTFQYASPQMGNANTCFSHLTGCNNLIKSIDFLIVGRTAVHICRFILWTKLHFISVFNVVVLMSCCFYVKLMTF